MQKLVEREPASGRSPFVAAPALAVQFFLVPLAVVAVVVAIYAGFRVLLSEERTPGDYLEELMTGRGSARWVAAYQLSRAMGDPAVQRDAALGRGLVAAFRERPEDPRVRKYVALALGRLDPPPPGAVDALVEGLQDADSDVRIAVIWALAAIGDPAAVAPLQRMYATDDAGIRKMVVYALGRLPGDVQRGTLETALADSAPDVQWNAAVALAERGDPAGIPVIRRMLDRAYLERTVTRSARPDQAVDPIAEVLLSGVQAAAALKAAELRPALETLSRGDRSLKVREAAAEALGSR
ncbi:MAG TPA: HEAT repeat domain-containing protein [Vicinamibacterales bacterium]|nr:HEAT repeat domain-containing protein [Vicinamibacterales bacterium]